MIIRSNYLAHIYAVIFYVTLLVLARYDNFSFLDNILLLITLFVFVIRYKPTIFLYPREFRFLLLLFLWSLLGIFVVISQEKFINFIQAFLNFTLSFFLTYHFQKFIKTKFIVTVFLISIIYIYIDIRFINYQNYLQEISQFSNVRLSGLLDDSNRLARIMMYGVILVWIHSILNKTKLKLHKFLIYPLFLLCFIDGILLSGSRSTFALLLLIMVLYLLQLFYISKAGILLKLLIVIICLFIIPSIFLYTYEFIFDNYSVLARFETIDNGTKIRENVFLTAYDAFTDNFIFGVGLGNLSLNSASGLNSHNDLMEVLASTGILGFILYAKFNYVIVRKFISINFSYLDYQKKYFFLISFIMYFAYMFSTWHFLSLYSGVFLGIITYLIDEEKIKKN